MALFPSSSTPNEPLPTLDAVRLRRQAPEAAKQQLRACGVPFPADESVVSIAASPSTSSPFLGSADAAAVGRSGGTAPPTLRAAAAPQERNAASFQGLDDPLVKAAIGVWSSDSGECGIYEDHITCRLYYEEEVNRGTENHSRLHGWLVRQQTAPDGSPLKEGEVAWQATLAVLGIGQEPWYGPSFGEEPEPLGEISVRFFPAASDGSNPQRLETIIRDEEMDWGNPSIWRRDPAHDQNPTAAEEPGAGEEFGFGGHVDRAAACSGAGA